MNGGPRRDGVAPSGKLHSELEIAKNDSAGDGRQWCAFSSFALQRFGRDGPVHRGRVAGSPIWHRYGAGLFPVALNHHRDRGSASPHPGDVRLTIFWSRASRNDRAMDNFAARTFASEFESTQYVTQRPRWAILAMEVIPRNERKSVDPAATSKGNFNGTPSTSAQDDEEKRISRYSNRSNFSANRNHKRHPVARSRFLPLIIL